MKKKISEVKIGDKVVIDGNKVDVKEFETSNIGKHGAVKCRIAGLNEKNERVVAIKNADEEIEVL